MSWLSVVVVPSVVVVLVVVVFVVVVVLFVVVVALGVFALAIGSKILCKKPFMAGNVPFGCGQCLPCRINRRRQWMWRQFLESLCHEENAFVTLTYDDKHLPADGGLEPKVVSDWLKRVRFAITPRRIRYFLVGEYGEETRRPHYHVSLFGLSGRTDQIGSRTVHYGCSQLLWDTWGKGYVKTAEFNEVTAQYVAGYVVKKLTDVSDPRLRGLPPEFARMSTRPGLGAHAMEVIAAQLNGTHLDNLGDVPHSLKVGSRTIPLGRYLLQKLRKNVGFSDEYISKVKNDLSSEKQIELLALFQDTFNAQDVPTFKKVYLADAEHRLRQAEGRSKLWKKKGSI